MSILLYIYLAVFVFIGVLAVFQPKGPDDFYASGKRCGVFRVTVSLLSTILGSSAILGTVAMSQSVGWAAAWMMLCGTIGLLFLIPLAQHVRHGGNFTLPDLLENFYGQDVKRLACAFIPAAWTGVIAAQVIGAGKILAFMTPLSYTQGALLTGTVFITYTICGGQISVMKTDTWQGLFIAGGLGAAVFAALRQHGLPAPQQIAGTFPFSAHFTPADLMVLLLTYATAFTVGPDIYSRLFCARNERTATLSVMAAALCLAPAGFLLAFIGTTAHAHTFAFLTQGRLAVLIAIGLLSAVISSADTTLLTAASTFSELFTDLRQPSSIKLTRILIGLFGAVSVLIAILVPDIIQTLLLAFAFFSGAFIIPVIAGLLGFRARAPRVMAAILCGGTLALTGKILALTPMTAGNLLIAAAFAVNAAILFSKGNRDRP